MSLINDDLLVTSSSDGGSIEDGTKQKIILKDNDNSNTYPIYAKEVEILSSKNSSTSINRINASNKIKVNHIVSYEWEPIYNNGQMIAVHKSSQYFAYTIRSDNNDLIRIRHKNLKENSLLTSFNGRVVDLSFAHYDAEVLLGCVEESSCLQIFKITLDAESKMQTSILFHLSAPPPRINTKLEMNCIESTVGSLSSTDKRLTLDATSRIIWCMYIPDSSENTHVPNYTDASKVFVLTRQNRAEIFNLSLIEKVHDCSRELTSDEITTGHLIIDEHKSTILSVSLSPDGSAVATSCLDGEVSFFKISFDPTSLANGSTQESTNSLLNEKADYATQPRCLKKWYPHDNKPVTSLYFLDDHKNPASDAQFWSFILTGADYNREIKLWCCLKWECMQTIRFSNQSPFVDDALSSANQQPQMFLPPQIKTFIDLSSKYLVLSDLTRKCFYVLNLLTDVENDKAKFTAISEFILAYPAVSFAIIDSQDIETRKNNQLNNVNTNNNNNACLINEDLNSNENSLSISAANHMSSSSMLPQLSQQAQAQDSKNNYATMIRLYCIQTKQLQEMTIFLNGEQSVNAYSNSSVSPTPQLNTAIESSGVLLASASQNGSNSSLLLHQILPEANKLNKSKMNTSIELKSDVGNSVTPDAFLNSPNNNLFSTQVDSATNLTSLASPPFNRLTGEEKFKEAMRILETREEPSQPKINSNLLINFQQAHNNSTNSTNKQGRGRGLPRQELDSGATNNLNFFSSPTSSSTQITSATNLNSMSPPAQVNGTAQNQLSNLLSKNQTDMDWSSDIPPDKKIAALSINSPKSSNLLSKVSMENEDTLSVTLNQNGSSDLKGENVGEIKGLLTEISKSIKYQYEDATTSKSGEECTLGVASSISGVIKNEQQIEAIVQQTLANCIVPRIEKIIKEEINKSIQSLMVAPMLDPLAEKLAKDMAEKMRSIEDVLKDGVSKMFKSKTLVLAEEKKLCDFYGCTNTKIEANVIPQARIDRLSRNAYINYLKLDNKLYIQYLPGQLKETFINDKTNLDDIRRFRRCNPHLCLKEIALSGLDFVVHYKNMLVPKLVSIVTNLKVGATIGHVIIRNVEENKMEVIINIAEPDKYFSFIEALRSSKKYDKYFNQLCPFQCIKPIWFQWGLNQNN